MLTHKASITHGTFMIPILSVFSTLLSHKWKKCTHVELSPAKHTISLYLYLILHLSVVIVEVLDRVNFAIANMTMNVGSNITHGDK